MKMKKNHPNPNPDSQSPMSLRRSARLKNHTTNPESNPSSPNIKKTPQYRDYSTTSEESSNDTHIDTSSKESGSSENFSESEILEVDKILGKEVKESGVLYLVKYKGMYVCF